MALIKCPECGREVSDRAQACPQCGCPIAPAAPVVVQASSPRSGTVAVQFPNPKGWAKCSCKVWDSAGNVLAQCRQGEVATFSCSKPMLITVGSPTAYINRPEITVSPGDRLRVYDRFGYRIAVSKVDTVF